jgi:ribose-phosphate pyrophosphokinase
MRLFSGSSHPRLAAALAKELKVDLGKVTLKAFSNGERYVRFEDSIRGKDVYILQTGTLNPNEDLAEIFLLCQAAKLSFAKTVHVVMPHFPYARQDRVAAPREPISAKLIAHLLEESGADHVITMHLHSDQIQGFFSIPVDVLDARPIFAEYLRKKNLKDFVIVAPDIGSAKDAKKFADLVGAELAILHKSRPGHHKAEILEVVGDVKDKTCVIVDDMIDTASTLAAARGELLKRGARKDVYAMATHAIFSGPAVERLKKARFKEIVVSDSLPLKARLIPGLTILPIAPMLAEVIGHMQRGESVTAIYRR